MGIGLITIGLVIAIFFLLRSGLTLEELQSAREAAGSDVIHLREECHAEGFTDDGTWEEKWNKANESYNKALEAEENGIKAQKKKDDIKAAAERIGADSERLASARRGNLRPDYDPRQDPRASGRTAFPTANEWGIALQTWASARRPDFQMTDERAEACRRCRANPHAEEFLLPTGAAVMALVAESQNIFASHHPDRAAAAVSEVWASWNTRTPESAAYVAEPPSIIRQLEINKQLFGGLLQVATVRMTTTGEDISIPFTDDTSVRGRRIAQDGPIGTERNPTFGLMKWGAHKYTSDEIFVTYEMLRDAWMDLEAHIGEIGGQRLGRIENYECTNGTGNSMPRGIVFSAPVGKTTASNAAITTDEIIDLEVSVDDAYIQGGTRVGYMMHKLIAAYLRKLKDLQGRPFYILGQETGNRDELNGKSIYINYDMESAIGASKDVMLYGDLAKYVVRRVGGTRLVRDPYTQRLTRDCDVFAAIEYMDGNLINAGNAPVKKMRMHS